jgi:hypothetical protein
VGALSGLIAHHPSGLTLAVELGVVALVVLVVAGVAYRERRRRLRRGARAELRDGELP